jgi:hypothetical protein
MRGNFRSERAGQVLPKIPAPRLMIHHKPYGRGIVLFKQGHPVTLLAS